jgi:hypothetical protein
MRSYIYDFDIQVYIIHLNIPVYVYIKHFSQIHHLINKVFCYSPTDAQQWSYQARSYDDSVTYKSKIQIK